MDLGNVCDSKVGEREGGYEVDLDDVLCVVYG